MLQPSCLSDLKRFVCASVYMPVTHTGVLFPCKDICTAVTYLGTSCAGVLEGVHAAPDCSLPFYIDSTNPSVCNAMATSRGKQLVSNGAEPYIGATCAGITTNVYIPAATMVNPLLAPLQPPFVVQSMLEMAVTTWQDAIPQFLTSECLTNYRKLACGTVLMAPYESHALDFLFGPLQLPSFPDHQVCVDFNSACASFIAVFPAFATNCSATTKAGLHLYPKGPQSIFNLNLGWAEIDMISPSNKLFNTTLTLHTQCPYAYAVPDHPEYEGISYIAGSGCAIACPMIIYPEETISRFRLFYEWSNYLVFHPLVILILFNIYLTQKDKRKLYLIVVGVSLFAIDLMTYVSYRKSAVLSACESNATLFSAKTYLHNHGSYAPFMSCYMSAIIINFFLSYTLPWVYFAVCGELFCRVVFEMKSIEKANRCWFAKYSEIFLLMLL